MRCAQSSARRLEASSFLRARVAVAEVLFEIEAQPLGQAQRLRDRLWMVGEAVGHRPRRAHHMAAVAAAQRLGGVEREAMAQRHEGVLQLGARGRVRVHVAARHRADPEPPRPLGKGAVARAVVAFIGALQLRVEVLRAEPLEQRAQRGRSPALTQHRALGATRQADQALGVLDESLRRDLGLAQLAPPGAIARMGVGDREDPAEVPPAALVFHEQRDVRVVGALGARERRVAHAIAGRLRVRREVDLRAVDRAYALLGGRLRELHRARDRVVVCQRERGVPELSRPKRQLIRQRDPIEERVGRVAVQLDVGRGAGHRFANERLRTPSGEALTPTRLRWT